MSARDARALAMALVMLLMVNLIVTAYFNRNMAIVSPG